MATFKTTSGDYTITVNGGLGTLTVNGNLDVMGNVTYIDTSELVIQDPFIILNNSNTGVYLANSGVLTHTGNTSYAGIRYNRTDLAWEITDSTNETGTTGTWSEIATAAGTTPGAPENAVQFNVGNVFTGDANFLFDNSNAQLQLTGNLTLGNIVTTPTATADSATLYNKIVGSGGTGVYVKSPSVDDELVSKTKAIVFGIIF